MQLENKDKELECARDEIDNLRGLMEKKVINFEVEKRYEIFLEIFIISRNHLFHLYSYCIWVFIFFISKYIATLGAK